MTRTILLTYHLILMDQHNTVIPNGAVLVGSDGHIQGVGEAAKILAKTPNYYKALDAKGLALCGLAICGGRGDPPSVNHRLVGRDGFACIHVCWH